MSPASLTSTESSGIRALAARVRASKQLTRSLKRHWLTLLPHLTPGDLARLDAILRGETTADDSTDAPVPARSADRVGE